LIVFQTLESQLSKVEEEKLKLLMETGDYKSTVQTLKEELDESKHKIAHLDKEKAALQERLKAEELIREKVFYLFCIFYKNKISVFFRFFFCLINLSKVSEYFFFFSCIT